MQQLLLGCLPSDFRPSAAQAGSLHAVATQLSAFHKRRNPHSAPSSHILRAPTAMRARSVALSVWDDRSLRGVTAFVRAKLVSSLTTVVCQTHWLRIGLPAVRAMRRSAWGGPRRHEQQGAKCVEQKVEQRREGAPLPQQPATCDGFRYPTSYLITRDCPPPLLI